MHQPTLALTPRVFPFLLRGALFLLCAGAVFAQDPAATPARLKVVAKPAPPFVIANPSGDPTGLTVDVWKRVATELNLPYEIKMVEKVPQLIDALKSKEADVGLGALTITSE